MPHLPPLEPANASPEVRDLYFDFQRRMGCPEPPNFIKTQGHSLAVARGTWGLVQNVLVGGALPRTLKEMVLTAISSERHCRYCEAAHLTFCRMLGVEADSLGKLMGNVEELGSARVRDIVSFGMKCARDPQSLQSEDYETLRHHGLSAAEILELISISALAVYANIIADATGVEPDTMFGQV